jgi:hypothetical protein
MALKRYWFNEVDPAVAAAAAPAPQAAPVAAAPAATDLGLRFEQVLEGLR